MQLQQLLFQLLLLCTPEAQAAADYRYSISKMFVAMFEITNYYIILFYHSSYKLPSIAIAIILYLVRAGAQVLAFWSISNRQQRRNDAALSFSQKKIVDDEHTSV